MAMQALKTFQAIRDLRLAIYHQPFAISYSGASPLAARASGDV
jgi:hypothetical protein